MTHQQEPVTEMPDDDFALVRRGLHDLRTGGEQATAYSALKRIEKLSIINTQGLDYLTHMTGLNEAISIMEQPDYIRGPMACLDSPLIQKLLQGAKAYQALMKDE